MSKALDLGGQKFGRWFALWPAGKIGKAIAWACQCDCGNTGVTRANYLKSGVSSSCGCLRRELASKRMTTHGCTGSPEYKSFWHAYQRCNAKDGEKHNRLYGARGIEFRFKSFDEFFAHIGPKPSPDYSLDRIDNNGHYEPGNIRWATPSEQQKNRRSFLRRHKLQESQGIAIWR